VNDYSKTRRIPLKDATKEELIIAIKSTWMLDAVKNAERAVYSARIDNLLRKMKENCEKMAANSDKPIAYRLSLHAEWDKINRQLSKLQGI